MAVLFTLSTPQGTPFGKCSRLRGGKVNLGVSRVSLPSRVIVPSWLGIWEAVLGTVEVLGTEPVAPLSGEETER